METITTIALHYFNRVRNIGRYLSLRDSLELYALQKQFIVGEIDTAKVIFSLNATQKVIDQQCFVGSPYICLSADGKLEIPMAGYYVSENAPSLLSEIINSYFHCWEFQSQKTAVIAYLPFLKAVLFQYHQTKQFEKALAYFFDIVTAGFIINHEIVIWVMYRLLRAYEDDQPVEQFLEKFFKINKLADFDDWKDAPVSYFFWPGGVSLKRREHAFSVILDRGMYEINCLRNATNYDEYFNNSLRCAAILLPVVRFLKSLNKKNSFALNSFIELFSEVDADCGIFRLDRKRFPQELLQNFTGFLEIFKAYDPVGWRNRALEERAFVPYVIQELFFNQQFDVLPSAWQRVSVDLVMPFALLIHVDNSTTWQGITIADTIDILTQIQSLKEENDLKVFAFVDSMTQKYPYAGSLHFERAIAYDEMDYSAQALESMIKSILLQKSSAVLWKSLSIILDHLHKSEEAMFAWAIAESLERRATPYAHPQDNPC